MRAMGKREPKLKSIIIKMRKIFEIKLEPGKKKKCRNQIRRGTVTKLEMAERWAPPMRASPGPLGTGRA